jgi:hypothetical protein
MNLALTGEERDDVEGNGAELGERLLPGRQLGGVRAWPAPVEQHLAHLRVLCGGADVDGSVVVVLLGDGPPGGAERGARLPVLGGAGAEQRLRHGSVGLPLLGGGAVGQSRRRGGAAGGVGGSGGDCDGRQAAHVRRRAGRVGAQRGHAHVVVGRGAAGRAHQRRRRRGRRCWWRRVQLVAVAVAVVRRRAGAQSEEGQQREELLGCHC